MGVRGLSTFLRENRRPLAEVVSITSLADTDKSHTFVVDAWSFIYKLHFEHKDAWVYGGEYERFAQVVTQVVKAWSYLGIQCVFVFDGAIPAIKHAEVAKRQQTGRLEPANIFFRTSAQRRNEPDFLRENRIIPPLMYLASVSALRKVAESNHDGGAPVMLVWADGEADTKCVELAGELGGYVLGNDSDFAVLNREGYLGYVPMDDMTWESKDEDEGWSALEDSIASLSVVGEDVEEGWTAATKSKSKRRRQATVGSTTLGDSITITKGIIPPPPSATSVNSLSFPVYQPSKLASHLKIPIRFLPLLGCLVGNDFVPETFAAKFFERKTGPTERVTQVARVLQELSLPSGAQKGTSKKNTIAQRTREQIRTGGGVAAIISGAIQMLLKWDIASGEVERMVEVIIEALLQYGSDSDPAGPISGAVNPLQSSHFVMDGTRRYGPHPFFASSHSRYLNDVTHVYTHAYRGGKFAPRALDVIVTGTYWSNVFLEDPDMESCGRTIQEEVAGWVSAVLADGLPVGLVEGRSGSEKEAESAGAVEEEAEVEEDDEELIDVIEDQTDEEHDNADERGRDRGRARYPNIFPDQDEDDDEDYHFALDANGYPAAMLTKALKRLRREQKLSAQARDTPTVHSPLTPGSLSPTMGIQTALSPSQEGDVSSPTEFTFITAYFRRGAHFTSATMPVPTLRSLINPTSSSPALPANWISPKIRGAFIKNWQGPIQLQPNDIRLSLFLHTFLSNLASIRALTNDWVAACVALRWVILKLGVKLSGAGKWRKREAKAFLISCILGRKVQSQRRSSMSMDGSSFLSTTSGSSSFLQMTASSTAPLSVSIPDVAAASVSAASVQLPAPLPPLEATPRSIQLTAQLLVAFECVHHLSSVLLLSDRVFVEQAVRNFSGRSFHGLLARMHEGEDENTVVTENLATKEDQELFECLWSAVEEELKEEWWAEDWTSSAKNKKARKKERKIGAKATPQQKAGTPRAGQGRFGALAGFEVEA